MALPGLFVVQLLVVLCHLPLGTSRAVKKSMRVKGISYSPVPCKEPCMPPQDDFMAEGAKALWGRRGRADLQVMKQLGANHVRLYGNNPANNHRGFLDEVYNLGLFAVVGMSDWPYTQQPGNCETTDFNCFEQVKELYIQNLQNGFLLEDKKYHPAVQQVIVVNEPDLKLPGITDPRKFCRSIISAIDGMLEAEKIAGAVGDLVSFTVAFSYGICLECSENNTIPALGQMVELRRALLNPEDYGYSPRNDLTNFSKTRFINSFNTANPARDIRPQFLDAYEVTFPNTPVMIQEYHAPGWNVATDLLHMVQVVESSELLLGFSFFEFQESYYKGGSEEAFGMFGLGDYNFSNFLYSGETYGAWCLTPRREVAAFEKGAIASIPDAVTAAFGGTGLDYHQLCEADPTKVQLTNNGFQEILALESAPKMEVFITRLLAQLGGFVAHPLGMQHFAVNFTTNLTANSTTSPPGGWAQLVAQLAGRPSWTGWARDSVCIADRLASADDVGLVLDFACSAMTSFNCSEVPTECTGTVWKVADFVFGQYWKEFGGSPLQSCYFGGVATYTSFAQTPGPDRRCILGAPKLGERLPSTDTTTTPSPPTSNVCAFPNLPKTGFFWDPTCLASAGVGCNADGHHIQCRFCGEKGQVPCPQPVPAPLIGCTFTGKPSQPFFWDETCVSGGAGCMADGRHYQCRFCGSGPFPTCPSGTLAPPSERSGSRKEAASSSSSSLLRGKSG